MRDVHHRVARLTPAQREQLTARLRAVTPHPEPAAGTPRSLVAYVQRRAGAQPVGADDLRQHALRQLPPHMVPSTFIPVDELPVLPNGKIDRVALARRPVTGQARVTAAPAADPVEAQLMRIWDDLIDIREIGRDDNFFELGGHSLLLPRLVDRIHCDFGVLLPLGTVFQAPTVRGLGQVIRASTPRVKWESLVPIRRDGGRPPLYLVHGLGGEIGYFYNVAEYLDPEQPVYGLQAPPDPYDRIEPMAAHYLEEIRRRQPRGPYLIGGYCVGGCVAYEMARQLVEGGERVALLALIDTVMPGPRPLMRHLRRAATRPLRDTLAAAWERARQLVQARLAGESGRTADVMTLYGVPQAFQETGRRHYRAQLNYVPGPYDGDMWLFRSVANGFDHDLGWGPLVRGRLEIRSVTGAHSDVLKEPNVKDAARQLGAVIEATVALGA